MDNPRTLIYILDEETLGQLHESWPARMRAALCLDERGYAAVALLHEEEIDHAAPRLSKLLKQDDVDFLIVPVQGGYPTRKLSFGEEQQMCRIIAGVSDLPDAAEQYLEEFIGARDLRDAAKQTDPQSPSEQLPHSEIVLSFPNMAAISRRQRDAIPTRIEPRKPQFIQRNSPLEQRARPPVARESRSPDGWSARDNHGTSATAAHAKNDRVIQPGRGGVVKAALCTAAKATPSPLELQIASAKGHVPGQATNASGGHAPTKEVRSARVEGSSGRQAQILRTLSKTAALGIAISFVQIGFSDDAFEQMEHGRQESSQLEAIWPDRAG